MNDADAGDSGLFGKLPHSRPGTRSPRRAAAEEPGEEPAARPRPAQARRARAKPRPEPAPEGRRSEPPPPGMEREADEGAEEEGPGLEDLAWAGIAVTAEAATLGVRLFSRAIEAARRAAERR